MSKIFKKYKILLSILIISAIILPFTFYKSAETERVAVATSIGIDKTGDEIELSLNVVTPSSQGSATGGSIGTVKTFAGTGKNVSAAIAKISLSVGKSVGLAHCDAVIVSKDILNQDVAKIIDYFIRSNNLTSNAIIFVTDGKAKDVIKASASDTSSFALTISNIISFNKMFSFGDSINIDNFYINYFSESGISILPMLSTGAEDESVSSSSGNEETSGGSQNDDSSQSEGGEGQSQGGGGSQGQGENGGGAEPTQSGGGKQQNQSQKIIKNDGKIVVLKKGKYVCELNNDQIFAINLINPKSVKGNITAKNVNNDIFKNADLTYLIYDKTVKNTCYFAEDIPIFNFDINLILQIKEIVMNEYDFDSTNGTTAFLDKEVDSALQKTIHENMASLINLAKKEKIDLLKVYNKFHKFDTKKWDNYINSLDNKEDFLDKVIFTINVNIQGKL